MNIKEILLIYVAFAMCNKYYSIFLEKTIEIDGVKYIKQAETKGSDYGVLVINIVVFISLLVYYIFLAWFGAVVKA